MFVFEILNIIKFTILIILFSMCFGLFNKKFPRIFKKPMLMWMVFILSFFIISFNSFFTLTERNNIIKTQNIMSKQSGQIRNDNILNDYLNKTKPIKVNKTKEREKELLKQTEINKLTIEKSF